MWGQEVCRVVVVGECWGQGPGLRPVLKHLLEVSAEPRIRKPLLRLWLDSIFSP